MNPIYEPIEWVNYWVENNQAAQRILIIGDSVARKFWKALNRLLKNQFAVDLIATSCYPRLTHCLSIIENFFADGLEYKYIIVNLGAHHGYKYSTYDSKNEGTAFAEGMIHIFQFLEKKCCQLIVLSGTPEDVFYNKNNLEIQKRNEIIQSIVSKRRKCCYIDIYEQMREENYEYIDGWCHFREDGNSFIVSTLLSNIMEEKFNIIIVDTIKNLIKKLDDAERIYIYGNGKHGKILKKFLELRNHIVCGVVVSRDYIDDDIGLITLEKVEKDATIIVTPMEIEIVRHLTNQRYTYFFLADEVYKYIYMHNEIYS